MKKFVYCLCILLVGITTSAQNITQVEYWIDSDPGFGKGYQYTSFTADTFLSLSINLPKTLSIGVHHAGFRTKDANGKWSLDNVFTFHIIDTPRKNSIVQMEYWVDQDPGFGKATQWSGFSSSQFVQQYKDSIVPSLSIGKHIVGIRSKDSTGKWSLTNMLSISILDSAQGKIVAVEHFWDEDPGFGKATVRYLDSPVVALDDPAFELYTPKTLSLGDHKLFVRTLNDLGDWSHTNFVRTVTVIELAKDSIVIDTTVCHAFVSPLGTITTSDTQFLEIRLASGPIFRQYFYKVRVPVIAAQIVKNDTVLQADKKYDAYQWLDCNNGYQKLSAQASKTLIPPKTGNYALEVTSAGCKDTADCVSVPLSTNIITTDTSACDIFTSPGGKAITASGQIAENLLVTGPMFQQYIYNVTIPFVKAVVSNNNNALSTSTNFDTYQWYECKGGLIKLSGETKSTFKPTQNGNYAVVVTLDNCVDTSACAAVTTLSVDHVAENASFITLFPNPTEGVFWVNIPKNITDVQLEIRNALGQNVGNYHFASGLHVVDLSDQAHGMYVALFTGEFGVVGKVVVVGR